MEEMEHYGVTLYSVKEVIDETPMGKFARMTGKNVKLFVHKKKGAKQHLDPVDLPDGTYPAILSDEVYAKILERVEIGAKESTRNAKFPEMYLLRAGIARCA
jgi:hypothetical protein